MTAKEAEDKLWEIDVCTNCIHYRPDGLFEGYCIRITRNVDHDSSCECMEPNNQLTKRELSEIINVLIGRPV